MFDKLPATFELNGQKYKILRMDAFTQLSIAQRISPLVVPFVEMSMLGGGLAPDPETGKIAPEAFIESLRTTLHQAAQITSLLQIMPTSVAESVYRDCLRCVERQGGEGLGWQKIVNPETGSLLYQDIEGVDVLLLTVEVIKDQLGNFMQRALSTLS